MDKKIKKLLKNNVPFEHYFDHSKWTVETDGRNTVFTNKQAGVTIEKRGMVCLDTVSKNGWYIVQTKDLFDNYQTLYTPEMDMLCSKKFDKVENTNDSSLYITKTRFSKHIEMCYRLYNPGNDSFVFEDFNLPFAAECTHISREILMNNAKVKPHNLSEPSIFVNVETGEYFVSTFEEDLSKSIYERVNAEDYDTYTSKVLSEIEEYKTITTHSSYLNLFYSNKKLIENCNSVEALSQAELEISVLKESEKASPAMLEKFRMLTTLIKKQKAAIQEKEGSQPGEE